MRFSLNPEKHNRVHLIGIGGISMSGIASVLQKMGFEVQGSDRQPSHLTDKLQKQGVRIFSGHNPENIKGADLIVYTAAVAKDNPELLAAKKNGTPVLERSEFLGILMDKFNQSIAVAGAHGKTTTTSMIATILVSNKTDPTVLVGGELDIIGGNYRTGNSPVMVTEACEYVDSFLKLRPWMAVVLNIAEDHLDYFSGIDEIRNSFEKFMKQVKPEGYLVVNLDDPHIRELVEKVELEPEIISFGLEGNPRISARNITPTTDGKVSYTLLIDGQDAGRVNLNVPGQHNVLNSLAAVAVGRVMGLSLSRIKQGLALFWGTKRRFETKGRTLKGARVIDDYAHHPDEIEKTLAAASSLDYNRLWVIFQPHLYSRTRFLLKDFARVLSKAPNLIITEIYAAREVNDGSISSRDLVDKITELGGNAFYVPSLEEAITFLNKKLEQGDLLLTLGAGDIYRVGEELVS